MKRANSDRYSNSNSFTRVGFMYFMRRLLLICFLSIVIDYPSFSCIRYVQGKEVGKTEEGHPVIFAEAVILQSTLYWKWQKEYDSALDTVIKYNAESDQIQKKAKCSDGSNNTVKSKRTILKSYIVESMKGYYQNWADQRKSKVADMERDENSNNIISEVATKVQLQQGGEIDTGDDSKETRFLRNSNLI